MGGRAKLSATDWIIVAAIAGYLVFVALLIVWNIVRRPPDPRVYRMRLGVFIERDREAPDTYDTPPKPEGWDALDDTMERP